MTVNISYLIKILIIFQLLIGISQEESFFDRIKKTGENPFRKFDPSKSKMDFRWGGDFADYSMFDPL